MKARIPTFIIASTNKLKRSLPIRVRKLIPYTLGGDLDNYFNEICFRHLLGECQAHLSRFAAEVKPKRILEIGSGHGFGTKAMIKATGKGVEYYGFDLFDGERMRNWQFTLSSCSLKEARMLLKDLGCKFRLFKGDSKKTLPKAIPHLPKMDLIYIDGNHEYEFAKSDWENSRKLMHEKTVVIFDDYNSPDVRRVVNEIDEDFDVKIVKRRFALVKKKI
jgi:predicted O-methyltransferase YrrM